MAYVQITIPGTGGMTYLVPHNLLDGLQGDGPDYYHLTEEQINGLNELIDSGGIQNLQQTLSNGNISTIPILIYSSNNTSLKYDDDNIEYAKIVSGVEKRTKINFINPTNNVSLSIPAKSSNDTFAMLSDITGGNTGTLQEVTDLGHTTTNPITSNSQIEGSSLVTRSPISNFSGIINAGLLTDERVYQLPDNNGTFLTDFDLSNLGLQQVLNNGRTATISDPFSVNVNSGSNTSEFQVSPGNFSFNVSTTGLGHSVVAANAEAVTFNTYEEGTDYQGFINIEPDGMQISSTRPDSFGIIGNQDFSANNDGTDRKIYPQTGWVQDAIQNATSIISELNIQQVTENGSTTNIPITVEFTSDPDSNSVLRHSGLEVNLVDGSQGVYGALGFRVYNPTVGESGGTPAGLYVQNVDGYVGTLKSDNLDNNRSYQFPNTNGIIALESYVNDTINALPSVFRPGGNYDASVGTFPTTGTGTAGAVRRGDTYNVSVAGTIGGQAYDIGDNFYANVNNPGQTTGNWSRFESNTNQATDTYRGTLKLYTSTGSSTDGTMDRNSITTSLSGKQSTLISGTNIKTVGGISLLGSGNITEVQNSLVSSSILAPSVDSVNTAISLLAPINNPSFTGTVTIPTGALTITGGGVATYINGTGAAINFGNTVRTTALTGFVAASGTVTATDTVLQAFQKLAGNTLSTSATLDFASTSSASSSDLTVTLTGATLNDVVILGVPNGAVLPNTCYTAWVSATNTVTVRFNNYSALSANPASGTFTIKIIK